MARIRRLLIDNEPAIYHVMSRTALGGFPLTNVDKDIFVKILIKLSKLYFTDVIGFCVMGNHFHILVRMYPESHFPENEVLTRLTTHYGNDRTFSRGQIPFFRKKLSNLSEFMKEIKLQFTRYYNKKYDRTGFFWGQRFKSVIIENNEALLNCLAYIDLNPVRAAIVEQPEDYRWGTLGYLVQSGNRHNLLTLEFGINKLDKLNFNQRLAAYREFVYEIGSLVTSKGKSIDPQVLNKHKKKGFSITSIDRLKYKTKYFTDSGIIGSKKYVQKTFYQFKNELNYKRDRIPIQISDIETVYSLKQIRE